ncbi:hypothetical protein KCP70_20530 [Salmonella enterica subsp. enterica]|nr:hypothetical protein KCP70_20530 [Salmonella enterica subsp. enterica]
MQQALRAQNRATYRRRCSTAERHHSPGGGNNDLARGQPVRPIIPFSERAMGVISDAKFAPRC